MLSKFKETYENQGCYATTEIGNQGERLGKFIQEIAESIFEKLANF